MSLLEFRLFCTQRAESDARSVFGVASHDDRANRNKQEFDPKSHRASTQRAEPDARRDPLKLGAVRLGATAQETRRVASKISRRLRNDSDPRCGNEWRW